VLANTLFMPRQSRDSRSRHRQSARSMSAADNKIINQVRKKQKAIEDERKKAQLRRDKEAKEREKEAKERQRELDRAQKEKERALQAEKREARKEAERIAREQGKQVKKEQARREGKSGHGSSGFVGRREKQTEMRKARAEASALVLQSFDDEEEQVQRDQMALDIFAARLDSSLDNNKEDGSAIVPASSSLNPLDSFFSGLSSFQEELSVSDDTDIEQILDAFNCLYALRGFLGISADLTFNKFIRDILGNPMTSALQSKGDNVNVENEGALIDDDESRQSSRLIGTTQSLSMQVQIQDAAELDRIQLNVLRALLPDLHSRFALDEDTDTSAPKKETSKKVWLVSLCFLLSHVD
jgi:hypothetical protein